MLPLPMGRFRESTSWISKPRPCAKAGYRSIRSSTAILFTSSKRLKRQGPAVPKKFRTGPLNNSALAGFDLRWKTPIRRRIGRGCGSSGARMLCTAAPRDMNSFCGTISAPTATPFREEVAEGSVEDVVWRDAAPKGKLDLVVDLNFRMDTSALYSDVVLPAASWYEKNDLNTTDLHSYIHPLGAAVPPCWESKSDWDIFRLLAEKTSELAGVHFTKPFQEIVATPLLHDTPDELAQPEVRDWAKGECEPIPGKTMPHLSVVERDYPNLIHRFNSLGPEIKKEGIEDHGIHFPVADLYDEFAKMVPSYEWDGTKYPSLVDPLHAANMILHFAPETNGEVAYRGFKAREEEIGLPLADLAEPYRGVRCDFAAVTQQPRRILTSPCWSGIVNNGRAYSGYVQNVERLVPWRTLTGRQHFYLDHEAYRAFGESLATFKPPITLANAT